jgi:TRAP-type uncharacterized transport system substrate-binding protein
MGTGIETGAFQIMIRQRIMIGRCRRAAISPSYDQLYLDQFLVMREFSTRTGGCGVGAAPFSNRVCSKGGQMMASRNWRRRLGGAWLAGLSALLLGIASASPGEAQVWPFSGGSGNAAGPVKVAQAAQSRAPRQASRSEMRERLNSWTVGLAAGRLEGAPLRFAAELSRVLDSGDDMRVLTVVTRGIFDNVNDLLYLRGIDAAIVYGDVLEEFKDTPALSARINYIANLFPAEMHVFVGPDIKTLKDLDGKKVNFNTKGTAAAYTGPIVFDRLGSKAERTFIPHPVAIGKMVKGEEYAGVVFVSSKPLTPFLRRKWPNGFHFIPVPFTKALEQYYLPSYLDNKDYPDLIPAGEKIETIAVPTVLAAFAWQPDTDRYHRVARMTQYMFDRLPKLQTEPGYHPKWKDVNLAANVPGWKRFPAVTEELRKRSANAAANVQAGAGREGGGRVDQTMARLQAEKAAPNDPGEQERLFREFLKWSQRNKGR